MCEVKWDAWTTPRPSTESELLPPYDETIFALATLPNRDCRVRTTSQRRARLPWTELMWSTVLQVGTFETFGRTVMGRIHRRQR